MTRILVTGKQGQVGFELLRSLSVLGEVIAVGRDECDLAQSDQIERLLALHTPDIIVNAAAYTKVDFAEQDVKTANSVNAEAPEHLATWAFRNNALLVHYSTDYVFDGEKSGWYTEEDIAQPTSVYGRSKLGGEDAIRASGCKALIFRTSWAYGAHGENFLKTILHLAKERDSLRVISDQYGTPTAAFLIADITAQVLARYLRTENLIAFPFGTYHLTAAGETTWYEYARQVVSVAMRMGVQLNAKTDSILPIPAAEYETAAKRPTNSKLDTSKLQECFGLVLPKWQSGVLHVLNQIIDQ